MFVVVMEVRIAKLISDKWVTVLAIEVKCLFVFIPFFRCIKTNKSTKYL